MTYDLKGSEENRFEEVRTKVQKDLNFKKDRGTLSITEPKKLFDNARNDAEFFEDHYIMDFSLLVNVLTITQLELDSLKLTEDFKHYARHIYKHKTQENTYYSITIIDYLQLFNFNKKAEYLAKKLQYKPSCVPPAEYTPRFIEYLNTITNN